LAYKKIQEWTEPGRCQYEKTRFFICVDYRISFTDIDGMRHHG
jgi:hypothetical protein